jgi:hypothetical protein
LKLYDRERKLNLASEFENGYISGSKALKKIMEELNKLEEELRLDMTSNEGPNP